MYIYGDDDEFYPLEKFDENARKLKLRALNLQTKAYGGKHEFIDEMRQDVKIWLQNILED
jgi:predicted esterase